MSILIKEKDLLNEQELNIIFEDLQKTNDPIIIKELEKKIFLSTYRLVVSVAKRYVNACKKFIDFDDLCSIGSYGLLKAIRTFKNDKGNKFITYASTCIANEIGMDLRKLKKIKNECSLNAPLNVGKEKDEECTLEDFISSDVDVIETAIKKDGLDYIEKVIDKNLKQKNGDILKRYFAIGYEKPSTAQEIGDVYELSRSRISRIITSSIDKLRGKVIRKEKNDDRSQ